VAVLESVDARTVQDQGGLVRPPEVELGSGPPPMLYAGSFSEARISVKGYEIGGVPTKSVALELDPFDLNLLEGVMSRTVSIAQPLSGRLQVNFSKVTSLCLSRAGFAAPPQSVELTHEQILLILSDQLPMRVPIGY
jgi:hypothetical protein